MLDGIAMVTECDRHVAEAADSRVPAENGLLGGSAGGKRRREEEGGEEEEEEEERKKKVIGADEPGLNEHIQGLKKKKNIL